MTKIIKKGVTCPYCGNRIRSEFLEEGKLFLCEKCGKRLVVLKIGKKFIGQKVKVESEKKQSIMDSYDKTIKKYKGG